MGFLMKHGLEAVEVSVRIGRSLLLRDVSLAVVPGELLVVIGANGAGKSTLLKVLCGDRVPDAGQVFAAGRPLARWPLRDLAKIRAVLPQDSRLAFPFTALEVVLMGRYPYNGGYSGGPDLRLARAAMAELAVEHLERRLYPTLSGGERARVQFARALCQLLAADPAQPPILLLDEPTASLDLVHQHTALEAARRFVRERGAAVCAVLHDLNLAAQYADRIAVIAAGRLAARGTPGEVLTADCLRNTLAANVVVTVHPELGCPLVATLPPIRSNRIETSIFHT
jgi:iron complex transport system ATP-binding protein